MSLLEFEIKVSQNRGYRYIGGIDEVGRGCLAGPLVTAIVVYDIQKLQEILLDERTSKKISSIKDSKKLSAKKREELAIFIKETAHFYHIQENSNIEIDLQGIGVITNNSFLENYSQAQKNSQIDFVFTDAISIKNLDSAVQESIVKGDSTSLAIASASIIAKVYRDNLMKELACQSDFQIYQFENHKGYGTSSHIEIIKKHGPSNLHRKSFEPLKSFLANLPTNFN
jgi:ribonuclease HII